MLAMFVLHSHDELMQAAEFRHETGNKTAFQRVYNQQAIMYAANFPKREIKVLMRNCYAVLHYK